MEKIKTEVLSLTNYFEQRGLTVKQSAIVMTLLLAYVSSLTPEPNETVTPHTFKL